MSRIVRALALVLPALLLLTTTACAQVPGGSGTYGIVGLVILVIDIWAIIKIVQSGATPLAKAIWVVVVLCLGPIGVVLWLLLGRN
jgi:hypothetical protein